MHRIVITAFKAVAFSIIFVVVWSVVFYLLRVSSLNSRLETVMVSMQQDVAKNNYLTEDAYTMYESILRGIADDMNTTTGGSEVIYDNFIVGFRINYNHGISNDLANQIGLADGSGGEANGAHYSTVLSNPGNAGDIAVIELTVVFNAITWGHNVAADSGVDQLVSGTTTNSISYVYQVPCLRYISVTE